jgi:predicted nucleic acid-binding protein
MISAVCTWHVHHERAAQEIERRLREGETLVLAAPAMVEAYAVLTRLPPPHRISPADSWALLEGSFLMISAELVALNAETYRNILQTAAGRGIAGGRLYDAVIVACAQAAYVDVLLTFNERQFVPSAEHGPAVVVPT